MLSHFIPKLRLNLIWKKDNSLENIAWRNFAATYRTVHSHIDSDLRRYHLTSPQYTVLRILGTAEKSLPMNEIGRALIVTVANVTTIVDNLEKRHYVKRVRDMGDRRVIKVELTAQGIDLFKRINSAHRKQIAKLMQGLSRAELESLITYTTKIREKIAEENGTALGESFRVLQANPQKSRL